jgi:hypothetical protein
LDEEAEDAERQRTNLLKRRKDKRPRKTQESSTEEVDDGLESLPDILQDALPIHSVSPDIPADLSDLQRPPKRPRTDSRNHDSRSRSRGGGGETSRGRGRGRGRSKSGPGRSEARSEGIVLATVVGNLTEGYLRHTEADLAFRREYTEADLAFRKEKEARKAEKEREEAARKKEEAARTAEKEREEVARKKEEAARTAEKEAEAAAKAAAVAARIERVESLLEEGQNKTDNQFSILISMLQRSKKEDLPS